MKLQKILNRARANRMRILLGFSISTIIAIGLIAGADRICQNAAKNKIFRSVESISFNEVALVLGTGKFTARGDLNLHSTWTN